MPNRAWCRPELGLLHGLVVVCNHEAALGTDGNGKYAGVANTALVVAVCADVLLPVGVVVHENAVDVANYGLDERNQLLHGAAGMRDAKSCREKSTRKYAPGPRKANGAPHAAYFRRPCTWGAQPRSLALERGGDEFGMHCEVELDQLRVGCWGASTAPRGGVAGGSTAGLVDGGSSSGGASAGRWFRPVRLLRAAVMGCCCSAGWSGGTGARACRVADPRPPSTVLGAVCKQTGACGAFLGPVFGAHYW